MFDDVVLLVVLFFARRSSMLNPDENADFMVRSSQSGRPHSGPVPGLPPSRHGNRRSAAQQILSITNKLQTVSANDATAAPGSWHVVSGTGV